MSLQSQAVVSEHLSVDEICRRLKENYGARNVAPRPGSHSDYWIVEFVDHDDELCSMHAFLNSWAADDYVELGAVNSTLLSMELGSRSLAAIEAIIEPCVGWKRRTEADSWKVAS